MSDLVDVTITATRRPEILCITLESFGRLMFSRKPHAYFQEPFFDNCRAIINIDPVGPGEAEETKRPVLEWFSNGLVFQPNEASFSRAFKRVWDVVEADWVFHLEDDWELLKPVIVDDLMDTMDAEPDLAILRLPMFGAGKDNMKNWNKWFPWNGRYFECPADLRHRVGFCGHPSLIRGDWVKRVRLLLDPERNPEKQFQGTNPALHEEINRWRYGVWARPCEPPAIRDIGRAWMREHGFRKAGNKAFFTHWEVATDA